MFGDMKHNQNFGVKLRNKHSVKVVWILVCIMGKNRVPLYISPGLNKIILWDSPPIDINF